MSKKEISGKLPLTIDSSQGDLENYQVYGASGGVGEQTENLFDKDAKDTDNGYVRWHNIISTGAVTQDSPWDVTEYINVKPSTVYTASNCVGVGASICFYDTNKEYISGIPYNVPKPGGYGTLTFTTPNNCAYARTCVLTANQSGSGYEFERNVDVFMITEGSTAPASYIPFGYKIPILNTSGVTENLWDIDSWTGVTAERGTIERIGNGYKITATSNDAYSLSYANSAYVYEVTPNKQYTLSWDIDNIKIQGIVYVFTGESTGNTPLKAEYASYKTVTFRIPDNHHYLSFRVGVTRAGNSLTYSDIMLTEGSTAPDHYIPHRYESNYDLMLGGSKLYADEYLDFVEQKVYKRTANLVSAPSTKSGTINGVTYQTDGIGNYSFSGTPSEDTTILFDVEPLSISAERENWHIFLFNSDFGVGTNAPRIVFYYNNTEVDRWLISPTNRIINVLDNLYGNTINQIGVTLTAGRDATGYFSVMFTDDATTYESFIPYYQPVDPPAPFPTISLYEGKNTLTSTEDIKKVVLDYGNENISTVEINNICYDINDISSRSMIASEYSTNSTYTTGDFCYYRGFLYECINSCSGNWNSDNWRQTTLADILKGIGIAIEGAL